MMNVPRELTISVK